MNDVHFTSGAPVVYSLAMHPDLGKLESELHAALLDLNEAQTQANPAARPDGWNVQQIVEHLLLTHQSNAAQIAARVEKGRPVKTPVTMQQRIGQLMLITLGRFPTGFEAPAPVAPAVVTSPRSGKDISERASAVLAKLDELCVEAERKFGTQRSVTHFRLGPLSIQQWRRFHLVHGRHHIRQIEAIRREHGFDGGLEAA